MADDNSLYTMLGRLDGKVDMLLSNQTAITDRLDKHDDRLKSLEESRTKQTGVTQTVSRLAGWHWALIAAAIGIFAEDIKGFFHK